MRNAEEPGIAFADGCWPADIVAEMIANRRHANLAPAGQSQRLPARIYGIMAATSLLTFATLTAGYQLLFSNQLFA